MPCPSFIAAFGLLSSCAATTSPPTHVAAADAASVQIFPAISTETLKTITKTLSSDAFGGRAPTTPAEERTIGYIAKQFAAAGLQPGNNGSWYQDVPLVEITPANDAALTVRSEEHTSEPQSLTRISNAGFL